MWRCCVLVLYIIIPVCAMIAVPTVANLPLRQARAHWQFRISTRRRKGRKDVSADESVMSRARH